MSLFVYNPFRVSEELTPAVIRKPKMLAWLRVLLRPLKYMTDFFLQDYLKGITVSAYSNVTAYALGDRVKWSDNSVYELIVSGSTGVKPTGDMDSATNWRKILSSYIGADERVKYTAQCIILSYAVNKHFGVTSNPYIYFTEITPGVAPASITINVPLAVYNALGPNGTARTAAILGFVYKYTPAQFPVLVVTY